MEKSCAHECGAHGGQKRISNSQELELQATVGQLWEPETKLRSSARASCTSEASLLALGSHSQCPRTSTTPVYFGRVTPRVVLLIYLMVNL